MKKRALYSLGIGTILGLATVLAIPLTAPDDACAGGGCAPIVEQTPVRTVSTGSSCAAAESTLYDQLVGLTGCDGGLCSSMLMITQPCQMNDPSWYPVSGYLEFQCRIPEGPEQGPGGDPWGDGGGNLCTPVCRCDGGSGSQGLCPSGCRQVNCI